MHQLTCLSARDFVPGSRVASRAAASSARPAATRPAAGRLVEPRLRSRARRRSRRAPSGDATIACISRCCGCPRVDRGERAERQLAAAAERATRPRVRPRAPRTPRRRAPRCSARRHGSSSARDSRPRRCPGPAPGRTGVGGIIAVMRSPKPSRRRPAAASTSASYSPASSLRSRVSTLPRIGAKRGAGEGRRQLRDAPDAARADARRAAQRGRAPLGRRPAPPAAARGRRADPRAAASAAIVSPSGSTAGMSLALCTATSMASSSSASSISLTNSRLLPTSESGAVLQPVAGRLDDDDLDVARRRIRAVPPPSAPATAPAGCRACRCEAARASVAADRRYARSSRRLGGRFLGAEPEQAVQGVRIGRRSASRRATAFNCSVGVSSSFSTSSCVISSTRARASGGSAGQLRLEPLQLRLADRLEALAQRDDGRDDFARLHPRAELRDLFARRSLRPAPARSMRRARFSLTIAWRSSML